MRALRLHRRAVLLGGLALVSGAGVAWGRSVKPYLGVVATRGMVPTTSFDASVGTKLMSRTMLFARDNVTNLRLLVPNFKVEGGKESGLGSDSTVAASVEYPAGTLTQATFSGNAFGTIPDGGMLLSDPMAVSIPLRARFWVRLYNENPRGFFLNGFGNLGSEPNGDFCNYFDGDRTMSGTVSSQLPGFTLAPLAVLAKTERPSVLCIGTGRTLGHRDIPDKTGDMGVQARSIGSAYGYINAGVNADNMTSFIASHSNRRALAQYVSCVGIEYGTNDEGSEPEKERRFQEILSYFVGKRLVAFTCSPNTTSSDNWKTLKNQTLFADYSAFNAYLKKIPALLSAAIDVASVTSSQQAKKWNVDGTPGKWVSAADSGLGVNETQFANLRIAAELGAEIRKAVAG